MGPVKPSQLLQSQRHHSSCALPPEARGTQSSKVPQAALGTRHHCRDVLGTTGSKAQGSHPHGKVPTPESKAQQPHIPLPALTPSTPAQKGARQEPAGACRSQGFAPGSPSTWMCVTAVRLELLTMELPYGHCSCSPETGLTMSSSSGTAS